MKVIIAGGGIGGLTTALSLHRIGIDVKVFESAAEVRPLGVGINLLPHSVRILTHLDLLDKIANISVETKELVYANRFGQFFWSELRGRFAGYKWPQLSIHRGEFQLLLWSEVAKAIGRENLRSDCHLTSFDQDDMKVTATFVRKSTGEVAAVEESDLLIGADGINSEVRKLLYPGEGGIVYSGNVLYRGTARIGPFLTGASMAMIGSLRQKMVVYPIEQGADQNGSQLINWVANLKEPEGSNLEVRDWNRQGDKDQLLDIYKDWKFDWINVPEMIRQTHTGIFEFPMSDRNPVNRWTFGRVTLLGDAAHPMYPIGSNGASQAILDADALTRALTTGPDPVRALNIYDAERVPATARVVLQNRQKGPDFIMDLMEDRFPGGFTQAEIPHEELATVMKNYKEVAGFDIESLNAKG